MRTGSDLARTFDYWSPAFAPDPYPLLRQLRADCPVAHSDELDGYFIVSRYEDVNAVLRNHATFTSTVMTAPAIPVEARPRSPAARSGPAVAHPLPAASLALLHSGPRRQPRGGRP